MLACAAGGTLVPAHPLHLMLPCLSSAHDAPLLVLSLDALLLIRAGLPRWPAVGGTGEAELAYGGNLELSTDAQAIFRTRCAAAPACLPALPQARSLAAPTRCQRVCPPTCLPCLLCLLRLPALTSPRHTLLQTAHHLLQRCPIACLPGCGPSVLAAFPAACLAAFPAACLTACLSLRPIPKAGPSLGMNPICVCAGVLCPST